MARGDRDPKLPHNPLPDGLKHNPFAILRGAGSEARPMPAANETRDASPYPHRSPSKAARPERADVPQADSAKPLRQSSTTRDARSLSIDPAQRIVVRRERKGRGGKAVTIAEGPGLARQDLEALAKDAARGLGTGARVEDGMLVIQGDQADRLLDWLMKRGFPFCARGN